MPRAHMVYRFGAFELDPANRHLTTGAEIVSLTDPQSAMLLRLVSSAPDVVDKDDLAKIGWGGAAVSPNSIEQAISLLRRTLSQEADGAFIETVRHRGYRFVAPLQQIEREDAAAAGKSPDLRPFLSFLQGSRDLATLNRDAIVEARRAFEHSVELEPKDAAAHALLAMACALIYEASRIQPTRDIESLKSAVHHAQLATTIDPARADGWSTLGFALLMRGNMDAAPAAARKAVVLEPEGWRHWLRLAYVSWGEERVEAAQRALTLRPDLAILDLFEQSAITLTAVRLLAPHLTPENHAALLASARHKTKRDVEGLVAGLAPKPDAPTLVRKLPVRPVATPPLAMEPSALPAEPAAAALAVPADVRQEAPAPPAVPARVAPLAPDRRSRHVPAAVRRAVWTRDGGRCAFIGTVGRRTETAFLEFHHAEPYAVGGESTVENVELRCRAHNGYEARVFFGADVARAQCASDGVTT